MINYLSMKHLAVWVVFFIDLTVVFCSFLLAATLRFNFELSRIEDHFAWHAFITMGIYALAFYAFKSYTGVVRHASLLDIQRIVIASSVAVACMVFCSYMAHQVLGYSGTLLVSKSIMIIQFLLATFFMAAFRLVVKATYASFLNNYSQMKTRVLIYGAGHSGIMTRNTLGNGGKTKVFGFIDDNSSMVGKRLEGVPVFNALKVLETDFIKKYNISQLIISNNDVPHPHKKEVIEHCLQQNVEIKEVPPFSQWIGGELRARQIRPVRIEDLLGRGEISLSNEHVSNELSGKTVLVTGGAGSIGSEIVRQVLHYNPEHVIILDQAESPCHELEIALQKEFKGRDPRFTTVIGDVTNLRRMKRLFSTFRPDVVFHAAAYKHVPLMELNAFEAVDTNVMGTKCIADLAQFYNVEKFVMVSTDKAINPTNVMGTTKRVAEMYTQALNAEPHNKTQFIITRFGNVLGSNGSVIPLFRKQIAQGGPLTVTHEEITRYFMTIAEACSLVLEAGSMGTGGEIFVFDMGQPVKIIDLARKMIKLSGLVENEDIKIAVTGLRPGEKLYEELLANEENTLPTHHEKIMKAKVRDVNVDQLMAQIARLNERLENHDLTGMVGMLKEIVPEFISRNSKFESLDTARRAVAS